MPEELHPPVMPEARLPARSSGTVIPPMDARTIARVRQLEDGLLRLPQVPIPTEHVLHAGLYARTVTIPAGVVVTGVLVKRATLLIAQGDVVVFVGGGIGQAAPCEDVSSAGKMRLSGYNVVPAAAGRKQAFLAESEVRLTMVFPTAAATIEAAEAEFTDEVEALASRRPAPALDPQPLTEGV